MEKWPGLGVCAHVAGKVVHWTNMERTGLLARRVYKRLKQRGVKTYRRAL